MGLFFEGQHLAPEPLLEPLEPLVGQRLEGVGRLGALPLHVHAQLSGGDGIEDLRHAERLRAIKASFSMAFPCL